MTKPKSSLPSLVQDILNHSLRREMVDKTALYGTPPSKAFDEISGMAALMLKAPVAQVTLLNEKNSWFKSCHGLDIQEAPNETSFCAYALVETGAATVVLDATKDERFADNPFVKNPPHIRFYAGYPIVIEEQCVGTVCVYDFEPRDELTADQNQILADLANKAADLMARRITY